MGWGKEKQKTSNIVRTASFHMCRYMYYRYIQKNYCGEQRGVPRFEEITAKKKKKKRKRERIYWTEVRQNFARNTRELLVALGSWLRGFAKWTRHTNLSSFSGSEKSALPGVGVGYQEGKGGGVWRVNLAYGLPDFQEAKAVSICLGTWGWDSSEYKNALNNLMSARLEAVWRQAAAPVLAAAAAGSAVIALGP